jgi:hypothetical protein
MRPTRVSLQPGGPRQQPRATRGTEAAAAVTVDPYRWNWGVAAKL